jgi:cytochrome d ubiquinol oxidase subunit II
MIVMHGNVYAAESRAAHVAYVRPCARVAALVYLVGFSAAGVWAAGPVATRSSRVPIRSVTQDPLLKQVAVTHGAWFANYHAHAILWLAPAVRSPVPPPTELLGAGRAGWAFSRALALAGTI